VGPSLDGDSSFVKEKGAVAAKIPAISPEKGPAENGPNVPRVFESRRAAKLAVPIVVPPTSGEYFMILGKICS
jgi:hypothetical protein